jgi:hypothetical protein
VASAQLPDRGLGSLSEQIPDLNPRDSPETQRIRLRVGLLFAENEVAFYSKAKLSENKLSFG